MTLRELSWAVARLWLCGQGWFVGFVRGVFRTLEWFLGERQADPDPKPKEGELDY